jgi:hypothetical protein
VLWDLGAGEFGRVRACVADGAAGAAGRKRGAELALKSIDKNEARAAYLWCIPPERVPLCARARRLAC